MCVLLGMAASLGSAAAVDIDVGRQLFVDDWVIAGKRGIVRHWNSPTKAEDPVVWPGAAPRCADGTSFGLTNGTANLTY